MNAPRIRISQHGSWIDAHAPGRRLQLIARRSSSGTKANTLVCPVVRLVGENSQRQRVFFKGILRSIRIHSLLLPQGLLILLKKFLTVLGLLILRELREKFILFHSFKII